MWNEEKVLLATMIPTRSLLALYPRVYGKRCARPEYAPRLASILSLLQERLGFGVAVLGFPSLCLLSRYAGEAESIGLLGSFFAGLVVPDNL